MSAAAPGHRRQSTPIESAYVIRGQLSPEAITSSLQALLPTRHRPIARHRFTVLDTFDGRVRRTGTRLTQSGTGGASILAWRPSAEARDLVVRLKQPVSFAWDLPDGPLQRALTTLIGVRRLFAQADAEKYGSLLEMLDGQGKTVARLRIEGGRARSPKAHNVWQPLPTVITLTGLRGYEDVYQRLVPVVESRPGIESCPEGLHGVMLRLAGVADAQDVSSPLPDLPPTVRADVGVRQIHRALAAVLAANEPGLRANLDTEFLHDFRVAVRRTRSLLRQIRDVFPPAIVEHFSAEFSWLGRATGRTRDIDVLVLAFRTQRAGIPQADWQALSSLLAEVQRQEHDALIAALNGDRYQRLLSEWTAFLERPFSFEACLPNAQRPLADVVSHRAWGLYKRIARTTKRIDERTTAAQLHDVRIDAKKLRYLIDVLPSFSDAEHIPDALKRLQRVLGDFNDAYVHEERLLEYGRSFGAGPGYEGALLALGRLAERSCQRREGLRRDVIKALRKFCGRDMRSTCRRVLKKTAAKEH